MREGHRHLFRVLGVVAEVEILNVLQQLVHGVVELGVHDATLGADLVGKASEFPEATSMVPSP
jgi:hypothetical protein